MTKVEELSDLGDVHLVALSACQTALGEKGQDGVEINAMSYYFLNNGVKAVMASLWAVDDSSTSQLMRSFYSELASGKATKAQPVRQAQLALFKGNASGGSVSVITLFDGAGFKLFDGPRHVRKGMMFGA